jgi:hypothetical protein
MTAGPGSNGNIFQGVMETAHTIGASWRPVNGNGEAAAQEMRKMVRDLPEVFVALAAMYKAMAASCTDSIAMQAGTSDLLLEAEKFCRAPIPALQENATSMDRPHDDDVRRVQTDNPLLAAWDWERNQGYNPMH